MVLITCLIALVVLGFGWFALAGPTYLIIGKIEEIGNLPETVEPTINLIKNVIGLFLVGLGLGLIGWALIPRREEVTYPID